MAKRIHGVREVRTMAHPGLVPDRHDYARGFEDGLARAKARVERVAEGIEDLGVRQVLGLLVAELSNPKSGNQVYRQVAGEVT